MTITMTDHEVVDGLIDRLGPTLVAVISGCKSSYAIEGWFIDESGDEPTARQMKRLRTAYDMFEVITEAESTDLARLWFISSNVIVDTPTCEQRLSPCQALALDEFKAVEVSMLRFIADTHGY